MKNPNCENDKCRSATGEVRLLPCGGEGNIILCRHCFDLEVRFRHERNTRLEAAGGFALPTWHSLKVYAAADFDPEQAGEMGMENALGIND